MCALKEGQHKVAWRKPWLDGVREEGPRLPAANVIKVDTFYMLLTLTVRATYADERHGVDYACQ